MSPVQQRLADNLAEVRAEMKAACERAGRSPNDITLVAVTKSAEIDWVHDLTALGVIDLGENRPQQLIERHSRLPEVRWHLIGHLQRNKVRAVLPCTAMIHSVDSWRLLERIAQVAAELGIAPRVLLEVNVSGEESKSGFNPRALVAEWASRRLPEHVVVEGLMTMAPLADNPELVRPVFRGLRELRDELRSLDPQQQLPILSMGMSNDFVVAIEEGATHIRVGSRLFEGV